MLEWRSYALVPDVAGDVVKMEKPLKIAMIGHKRIPSREGGVEIVVEQLAVRMVQAGHRVDVYNRSGHHVSGKENDGERQKKLILSLRPSGHYSGIMM